MLKNEDRCVFFFLTKFVSANFLALKNINSLSIYLGQQL